MHEGIKAQCESKREYRLMVLAAWIDMYFSYVDEDDVKAAREDDSEGCVNFTDEVANRWNVPVTQLKYVANEGNKVISDSVAGKVFEVIQDWMFDNGTESKMKSTSVYGGYISIINIEGTEVAFISENGYYELIAQRV